MITQRADAAGDAQISRADGTAITVQANPGPGRAFTQRQQPSGETCVVKRAGGCQFSLAQDRVANVQAHLIHKTSAAVVDEKTGGKRSDGFDRLANRKGEATSDAARLGRHKESNGALAACKQRTEQGSTSRPGVVSSTALKRYTPRSTALGKHRARHGKIDRLTRLTGARIHIQGNSPLATTHDRARDGEIDGADTS